MNKLNNNEIADSKEFFLLNITSFTLVINLCGSWFPKHKKCVVPIFGAITKAITIKLVST